MSISRSDENVNTAIDIGNSKGMYSEIREKSKIWQEIGGSMMIPQLPAMRTSIIRHIEELKSMTVKANLKTLQKLNVIHEEMDRFLHTCEYAFKEIHRTNKNAINHKTVMCQKWTNTGNCAYGTKCYFAHGESELRPKNNDITANHSYKPRVCHYFVENGTCQYGESCFFIHPNASLQQAKAGSDPKAITNAPAVTMPSSVNSRVKSGQGVVCVVEKQQCCVYSSDFLIEPYVIYEEGQEHLELGQWIDFVAKETEREFFVISEYKKIEPPFATLRCKATVMVRCFVDIPIDICFDPKKLMNSSISRRVLCKDIRIIAGHQGRTVEAVLRYYYDGNAISGYWNVESISK